MYGDILGGYVWRYLSRGTYGDKKQKTISSSDEKAFSEHSTFSYKLLKSILTLLQQIFCEGGAHVDP